MAPRERRLLDGNGAVIATGVSGATNVDSAISNFVTDDDGVFYAPGNERSERAV